MTENTSLTLSLASIFNSGYVDILYPLWSAVHADDDGTHFPVPSTYIDSGTQLRWLKGVCLISVLCCGSTT
jgi:hypothetical protein